MRNGEFYEKSHKPSKINGLRRFERKCKKYEKQDKSANGLPRQVTKIVLKAFENQGFFQNPTRIYDTFTTDEVKL